MQWKIPQTSRLSQRFNLWALRRGFPALEWVAPRVPRWFLRWGARMVIRVVMGLHWRPRVPIEKNLRYILGPRISSREIRRTRWEMYFHLAYAWSDLFRFAQLPPEALEAELVRRDRGFVERLQDFLGQGKKLILLTAHLGNWEVGGLLAARSGLPLSIVYVRDQFEVAERFRSLLRRQGDIEEIPLDLNDRTSSLPILRALNAGRIVAMQGDRDFRENGEPMSFFGVTLRFPTGPFLLARMVGAEILPVFFVYEPDGRFRFETGDFIRVENTSNREQDVRRALEKWCAVLETAVQRWPEQWYTFYDFFESGGNGPQEREAASDRP